MNAGVFKRFAVAVLKIACGVVLATLVLGLIVWAGISYREASQAKVDAPLVTMKTWPEVPVSALANAKFHLKTVWKGGKIYYQFDVQGYPAAFREARDTRGTQAAFSLTFLDRDGFKIFEYRLPLADMTGIVDADGQPQGLSWKGDEYLTADLYRRASGWDFTWSGFPTAILSRPVAPRLPPGAALVPSPPELVPPPKPASPSRPKWTNVSVWRNLSHGASQDDVRQILGEPEKVSDLGFEVKWYYGYPSGGEVTFGKDRTVQAWSEP